MDIILLYSSKTNNTKKIADVLAERLNPIIYCPIKEFDSQTIKQNQLLIIGGWIDKGFMNDEVMEFIHLLKNQTVAFFFTIGAYPNSMYAYDCIENIKRAFTCNDNTVIGHYHCQGAVDPNLVEWMKSLPKDHSHSPDEDRINRWNDAMHHPNQEDFNSAKNFASVLLKKIEQNHSL